jgi:hypothetical protein
MPKRAIRSGVASNSSTAPTSAPESPGATSSPVSPSATYSGMPPILAATIGFPDAIASAAAKLPHARAPSVGATTTVAAA